MPSSKEEEEEGKEEKEEEESTTTTKVTVMKTKAMATKGNRRIAIPFLRLLS
jgi:hypothetical protein